MVQKFLTLNNYMSSEEKEILTDYLKELQKRIMKLQENEHYEVLKIIIKLGDILLKFLQISNLFPQ